MSEHKPDREVEVEVAGSGLLMAGFAVLALCVLSFWLGRWSAGPTVAVGRSGDPETAEVGDGGDVSDDLTFFDTLEHAPELTAQGDERTAAPPAADATAREPAAAAAPAPASGGGPYEVQVLASTDRAAAEKVLARLVQRGYPARLEVGKKDGGSIYRVRVVGYPDDASARRVAEAIEREEGLRTWVTQ